MFHVLIAIPWIFFRLISVWFNAIGATFVLAGAVMLVLPGQGLLTLLLGVLLTDLPIRRRVIGWLCRRRRLARALQRLRQRARQPPFVGLAGPHP